ncbi:Mov34-MPN-PAD-1 family protein [Marine Group I thaumarchaeote SCGC RSA3]|uniref:CysO-cysteine peptidase protein n=3 Tax=Marine Group I TaxID=905826 RepID=A0A081RP29_9ARCH|nr:CysO-cysteine peptidase protein [Marine Group I thaumarchaeote SCGC AAA799-N04]KFM15795.1 CysO-cysteine peptidase protein [Marine Group I thaumarchaeote SCGC AAA799-D11]KFM17127.1 Mov34-MPN-PAD-1 family protein [Marine Group I thaumarchaeote SCGC RSA3]
MQKIILSNSDKKILTEHAENEKPNESCAILFGKENVISEVFLTKNIDESPVNFTISNEQLIEGYKIAEEKKVDVIGIFHSHPNSEAYPSNTDKKFMQSNPVAWVIYSGVSKRFRAYVLESDIKEISIEER